MAVLGGGTVSSSSSSSLCFYLSAMLLNFQSFASLLTTHFQQNRQCMNSKDGQVNYYLNPVYTSCSVSGVCCQCTCRHARVRVDSRGVYSVSNWFLFSAEVLGWAVIYVKRVSRPLKKLSAVSTLALLSLSLSCCSSFVFLFFPTSTFWVRCQLLLRSWSAV